MSKQLLELVLGQFFSMKNGEHAGSVGVLKKIEDRYVLDLGGGIEIKVESKENLLPYKLV